MYKLLTAYMKKDTETIYGYIYDINGYIVESWRTMWDVTIIMMDNARIRNEAFLDQLYSFNSALEDLSEDIPKEEKIIRKEVKKFILFLETNYRGLV